MRCEVKSNQKIVASKNAQSITTLKFNPINETENNAHHSTSQFLEK
jgi:hypothetical protein